MSSSSSLRMWVSFGLALLIIASEGAAQSVPSGKSRDFDQPVFAIAKSELLDPAADDIARERAVREIVIRNAREAVEPLRAALSDRNAVVRDRAGEFLAMLGDSRGLQVQLDCLNSATCSVRRHQAIRLLGNTRRPEYATAIAADVGRVLKEGMSSGGLRLDEYGRAVLNYGALALARIGRPEDWPLVLQVAKLLRSPDTLEALGYVDDPASVEALWASHRTMVRKASCSQAGLGVQALVPLSRLGDRKAIALLNDILRGTGTVNQDLKPGKRSGLCADREQAFLALRSRDTANFVETVFEVAAQDPEGPGSVEAWTALGLMHPRGFGERVFKLAMSKKPHWKLVTRDILFNTVIAIEPNLNDAFWKEYGVDPIPTYSGQRALIEMGLGHLMFPGTMYWTGD